MKNKSFNSSDLPASSASTAPTQLVVLARFLGRLAARQWLADDDDQPLGSRPILSGGALGSLLNQPGTRITGGALCQVSF